MIVRRAPLADRLPDLPAVAERVIDASQLPAVLFAHGVDFEGTGSHRSLQHRPRIIDNQQHPHRCSANSLGAEVPVRWRLVLDPEQRVPDRELRHHLLQIIGATEAVHLNCPEGNLVEVHSGPTVPHRELGLDVRRWHGAFSAHRRIVASITILKGGPFRSPFASHKIGDLSVNLIPGPVSREFGRMSTATR
jgi:hypothetical protein